MKKAQSGITIIECIIYVGLSALLSFFLFRWWASLQTQIALFDASSSLVVQERLLYCIMTRDITGAIPIRSYWKGDDVTMTFHALQGTISYRLKKETLTRSYRPHNVQRGAKGVIARGITSLRWHLQEDHGQVMAVKITVQFKHNAPVSWHCNVQRGATV